MTGPWEIGLIVFVVILLFGAKKLPDLAGSVGESIKEFRKATKDALEDDEETTKPAGDDEETAKPAGDDEA